MCHEDEKDFNFEMLVKMKDENFQSEDPVYLAFCYFSILKYSIKHPQNYFKEIFNSLKKLPNIKLRIHMFCIIFFI